MDIIQSVWVGSHLSVMERMCIQSYLQNGHQFHLYVYDKVEGIPTGTTVLDANSIITKDRIFTYEGRGFGRGSLAGFADLFRYALLLSKGNWWVDMDSICLKPFDFDQIFVFSSESSTTYPYWINCGNLKAPANSELYKWLNASAQNFRKDMCWGTIGPRLMQKGIDMFNMRKNVKMPEVFCPVPFSEDVCAKIVNPREKFAFGNETYAIHLWNEAWRAKNMNKDANYPEGCLYEDLKKKYLV